MQQQEQPVQQQEQAVQPQEQARLRLRNPFRLHHPPLRHLPLLHLPLHHLPLLRLHLLPLQLRLSRSLLHGKTTALQLPKSYAEPSRARSCAR